MERKLRKAQNFYAQKLQEVIDYYYYIIGGITESGLSPNPSMLEYVKTAFPHYLTFAFEPKNIPNSIKVEHIFKNYYLKILSMMEWDGNDVSTNKYHPKYFFNKFMDGLYFRSNDHEIKSTDDFCKYIINNQDDNETPDVVNDICNNNEELASFIAIMDCFARTAMSETSHFEIVRMEEKSKTIIGNSKNDFIEKSSIPVDDYCVPTSKDISFNNYNMEKEYSILRTFTVKPKSEFGVLALYYFLGSTLRKLPYHFDSFSIPALISNCHNFKDYLLCILVNFNVVFEDFSRVKTCGYDDCGKMFYEKMKGLQTYCSITCKNKANVAKQDKERFRCQDRQNHWVAYQEEIRDPKKVSPDECERCEDYKEHPKGGHCEVLRKINPKWFAKEFVKDILGQVMALQSGPAPAVPANEARRSQQIRQIIEVGFDFPTMAKDALGTTFSQISEVKRQEFISTFGSLFRDNYTHKVLKLLQKENITYNQVSKQGEKTLVETTIIRPNESIPVAYLMHKSIAGWLLYDVNVDGVSILEDYRNQFSQAIQTKGFAFLLELMKGQRQAIK